MILAALTGSPSWSQFVSTAQSRAEQLVRDKLRREKLGGGDDPKVMRRLVGMLACRGYSQSMAFDVVTGEIANKGCKRRRV